MRAYQSHREIWTTITKETKQNANEQFDLLYDIGKGWCTGIDRNHLFCTCIVDFDIEIPHSSCSTNACIRLIWCQKKEDKLNFVKLQL